MNDRLGDLLDSDDDRDLEVGVEPTGDNEFMRQFFDDVNSIQEGMSSIRRNLLLIEEKYAQSLGAMDLDKGAKSSEELEELITRTNLESQDVRNKLKDLEESKKKSKEGAANAKIRANMQGALTKKFLDLMQEYQELQTKYKNKFRERVAVQYKMVKPDATAEEIDEAIDSGDTQIFAKAILDTERKNQAKNALAYIENKSNDIKRLEQSIMELHNLFLDMAILVEAQGELIDQIEYNVTTAVTNTTEAVKNLQGANKYQKKSRKKLFILMCIVVVVIIVVAGVLGGVIPSLTKK
eukprot:TRINITY_DN3232_c0_g2_i1.p1 TRINITY_DN3232_c0_g2~~TRINITY_DN3232_c0_g2_i1.p1  ORF type:complete len:295 (-),score=100.24 TRINITY_DN3232_c0_g2_i1:29-913(-)